MNIVYKFTSNLSGKFYIGSKQECEVIGGKIIDKTGKYYYSSCKDEEFWRELKEGHIHLDVLEYNVKREELLNKEAYWQEKLNYKRANCWNQVLATQLHPTLSKSVQFRVQNVYGQTTNEIAVQNSTIARLDSSAKKEGFSNNGERIKYYLQERSTKFSSFQAMDVHYHRKGFFKRLLRGLSLDQLEVYVDVLKLKEYMRNGATFLKSCEFLGIPHWVVRYKLGDSYYELTSKESIIAEANGFLTREGFNNKVLSEFLAGKPRKEIAASYNSVSISTVSRIIDSRVREILNHPEIMSTLNLKETTHD